MDPHASKLTDPVDYDPPLLNLSTIIYEENLNEIVERLALIASEASRWRGRCEGMAETIAYLRGRVATLEAREQAR